jgi:hypothetical protein
MVQVCNKVKKGDMKTLSLNLEIVQKKAFLDKITGFLLRPTKQSPLLNWDCKRFKGGIKTACLWFPDKRRSKIHSQAVHITQMLKL